MRNSIIYLASICLFFSCTDRNERDSINFTVSIENNTNTVLIIKGYAPNNMLEFEYTVDSNSRGGENAYFSETFGGYVNGADSIVFKFSNNKGYICADRENGNSLCFANKNPLVGEESYFNFLGDNKYEFEVTQEDFNNAYDLP